MGHSHLIHELTKIRYVRLFVTKFCQSCHLLNWSNLVEHIKSSLIELGLKFLFRVAYFTDGKKHPPQACREGGAKGVLVPPPPQQASEVHFLIDQWLKMKWNRVLKCDVIKMKFLKLWDLSWYSERDRSPVILRKLHTNPSKFFWVDPKKIRRVCLEFYEYNRLTSQRQFAPKCSFLVSRLLGHYSFRISWQIL